MRSRRNMLCHRGPPLVTTEYQVRGTQYQVLGTQRQLARATRNPEPGTRNPLRRAAFTLIELMIVVIIAVILLAATLPTVKYSLEEGKLREGARQFNAFFAAAKAQAGTTGRPAGVWLELDRIGDPAAIVGNRIYQCSQVYLAEIPAAYGGDILNARCYVTGNSPPYPITFTPNGCAASLDTLVQDGEQFGIKLDFKGPIFLGIRSGSAYQIIDTTHTPPQASGQAGYAFQIFRVPQRIGQPLELPQGVVIDVGYSGLGVIPFFQPPSRHMLVMFSPGGGVNSVTIFDQAGNVAPGYPDTGTSKVHFLVGKTERVEYPWDPNRTLQSNIADGSNLWVSVNRRNGSVSTVENTPNLNLPYGTPQQRQAFLAAAREFAVTGEVKGGQ